MGEASGPKDEAKGKNGMVMEMKQRGGKGKNGMIMEIKQRGKKEARWGAKT